MSIYLQVAVEAPIEGVLTYRSPTEGESIVRGQSVEIPLGKRQVLGVVMGHSESEPAFEVKPVLRVCPERPKIAETHLRWLEWLSDYYLHPLGEVVGMTFPPLAPAKKGARTRKRSSPIPESSESGAPPILTNEQLITVRSILEQRGFSTHLVHGVTGSGKTEVYLQVLNECLAQGRQGLVLVPEISLTPQLLQRFAKRFGQQIAVIHSHLTPREKTDQWWAAASGEKSILIGARSALFCPLPRLGAIIVDEEHEPSFKQEDHLKYHARDAAIMLGKLHDIPVILGSATPSIESWLNAQQGRYILHSMSKRVADRPMPEIEVVDLRTTKQKNKDAAKTDRPHWMSEKLHLELQSSLDRGEQSALFLNRRGVAQSALCLSCGHDFRCPNCAISLTVHGHQHLVCHYCDYTDRLPEHCPQCQSHEVQPLGLGTELVEREIMSLFPNARVARADRDEIHSREALEELISRVERREVDILIGTQMIAKGLDFPGLNFVGLVLADIGFHWPDFRASERSFQLLTQVAGRSGRHSSIPGKVLIQTYNPQHPAIVYTCQHAIEDFLNEELELRRSLHYPPFSRLALVRLQAPSLERAENCGKILQIRSEKLKAQRPSYQSVALLGPAPAPLAKLRGRFRFHVLIKAATHTLLNHFLRELIGDRKWAPPSTQVSVDINPVSML